MSDFQYPQRVVSGCSLSKRAEVIQIVVLSVPSAGSQWM